MADQNRAWNFPIQWSRAFGEDIRFRTEVITSRRGNEQRIAQRIKPRITYDFETFLNFDNFRKALQRMSDNQGQPIHFPHPQYSTETANTLLGSSNDDRTRAICIAVDVSDSMDDDGKRTAMKRGVTLFLEKLQARLESGWLTRLDINLTKFSGTYSEITFADADSSDMDSVIAFLNADDAAITGSDFDLAAQRAVVFFDSTLLTDFYRRTWLFVSDGQPSGGSLATALVTASDLIDQSSGDFRTAAGTEVDIHAINIEDSDVSSSEQLDNTPDDEVPVVSAKEAEDLVPYASFSIFGRSFNVDENPGWINRGDVLFLEDAGVSEMVTVASVIGTTICTVDEADYTFRVNTTARRGVSGYISGESKLTAATSRVGLSQIEVDADPVDTWHPDYSAIPDTFNGKEYFDLGNQWASDLRVEFMQPVVDLDLQRGDVDRVYPTPYTIRKTRLRFVLRNADHIDRLVGLFYRSRGRQKAFYMSQRTDEIRPLAIAAASNTFTVPGADFKRRYDANDMYRFVHIKVGATDIKTEIVQIAIDANGDSVATVADLFVSDIEPEDISSFRWICLCRFESDSLSLEWITDGVAETTVNIRTLEDPA